MSNLQDPRVLFAAERTLLAWNRTSLALIAFGFLIERSGLLMNLLAPEQTSRNRQAAIFAVGGAFILLGVVAALVSSKQYLVAVRTLNADEIPTGYSPLWGMGINFAIAILGAILIALMLLAHLH